MCIRDRGRPARGLKVEVVIGIDPLQVARQILIAHVDLDTHLLEVLLEVLGMSSEVLVEGRVIDVDRETDPVGLSGVAGLVQKAIGQLGVVGVLGNLVGGVELLERRGNGAG